MAKSDFAVIDCRLHKIDFTQKLYIIEEPICSEHSND